MKLAAMSWGITFLGLTPAIGSITVERQEEGFVVSGDTYVLILSPANGSILALRSAQDGPAVPDHKPILRSGERGLWHVRCRDGSEINAASFRAGSTERSFVGETEAHALQFTFRSPEIAVRVAVTGRTDGVDFAAQVEPREKTVLDFALPARLRFDPDHLNRFITPMNGNSSVGTACHRAFFQLQPQDQPAGWQPRVVGPKGYETLYGGPLDQRADLDPATPLQVTAEGRGWFSAELAGRIEGARAVVNRPPTRAQADLILVDSANGPYLSASHLGGQGFLWRLGGAVGEAEKRNAVDLVMAVVERLAAETPIPNPSPAGRGRESMLPTDRSKLGLIALQRGPAQGGWTAVAVSEWRERFRASGAARGGRVQVVELTTVREMLDALAADDFLAILNPYGEWTPAPEEGGLMATVEAVGRYVRAGGHWFEVGGYPFFYELRPLRYLSLGTDYPPGFADFFHLDTQAGTASIFRVQPQQWPPWAGAKDKEAVFVPGRLACGGDEQGGYCDRVFGTFVAPGESWRSPTVRLRVGHPVDEDLQAYCEANAIRRQLADKMSPELLEKFKNSVLVYYGGSCREKIEYLDRLPVPSQVHFADYLKGGFDKEYPDHLPPHPHFGTAEEFRAFFDRCHELGHLVMPYTNPTWWCDHPRGPTFEREGEEPLLKTLDGQLSYERYAANDGFTVCHWHPAVQAANRRTVRQFTEEYPVDILFQDQCGARGWQYDTNPASPTPFAYSDGLISMVAEDSQKKPLSTESGWDRVVNYESQLCGMSWALVPTEGGPSWRRLMKYDYPPETWTVFPLAQYIAHDKAAMLYHDLAQFVTNREVLAWTLGLGFCLSDRIGAPSLAKDAPREWLRWLDRLQKSVCARYVGEPVRAFEHDRGPTPTVEDDGVLRATYGSVRVVANLGPQPRQEEGRELPPYGFYATAPGMVAANLKGLGGLDFGEEGVSFVAEGQGQQAEVWVYAPPEQEVCVELPAGGTGEVSVTFDSGEAMKATVTDGVARFRLPPRAGPPRVEPPVALAGRAPRDWPGEKPAIGLIDVGEGVSPTWTRITPEDWWQALRSSPLAQKFGVPVRRLRTVEELVAALQAGPTAWFAILNPYGEGFPAAGPGQWRGMLELIRGYVNQGGCWWETGGYSLYHAFFPQGKGWQVEPVGPEGMSYLGLPVGGGEVDQAAEPLRVTREGRAWLGADLSDRVEKAMSVVNRGLLRGSDDPGHLTLVAGERQDFIGGYRLEGWGWFWRVGGFEPNPEVALPVAIAAMQYLYTHPPLPVKAGGVKYLWPGVVREKK